MADTCYMKHGYPPHLQRGGAVNNYFSEDREVEDDLKSLGPKEVPTDASSLSFTPEQHKALLTLLQNLPTSQSHATNQLVTS